MIRPSRKKPDPDPTFKKIAHLDPTVKKKPDPDPTVKKKPDPDPTALQPRFTLQAWKLIV